LPQARCRSPTRASGWNYRRQILQGFFRAFGIVMIHRRHRAPATSECLGHFQKARVGKFWKAPKYAANLQLRTLVALGQFECDKVPRLDKRPDAFLVIVIDCDGKPERISEAMALVPERLAHRVFILDVLTEPERLKKALGLSFETIGVQLAAECRDDTGDTWSHELLAHNQGQLDRMRKSIRPILFPDQVIPRQNSR